MQTKGKKAMLENKKVKYRNYTVLNNVKTFIDKLEIGGDWIESDILDPRTNELVTVERLRAAISRVASDLGYVVTAAATDGKRNLLIKRIA